MPYGDVVGYKPFRGPSLTASIHLQNLELFFKLLNDSLSTV
jgi:hypothetical protein